MKNYNIWQKFLTLWEEKAKKDITVFRDFITSFIKDQNKNAVF